MDDFLWHCSRCEISLLTWKGEFALFFQAVHATVKIMRCDASHCHIFMGSNTLFTLLIVP